MARRPFLFGDQPTLADAALYGQLAMIRSADADLPGALGSVLPQWMTRLESAAHRRGV